MTGFSVSKSEIFDRLGVKIVKIIGFFCFLWCSKLTQIFLNLQGILEVPDSEIGVEMV